MSKEQTMVQEAFAKIGDKFDGITNRLKRIESDLPFGAIEIEYLRSTGTQWIDTGIVPSTTGIWEFDLKFSDSGNLRFAGVGTSGTTAVIAIGLQSSRTTKHIPFCYSSWTDNYLTSVSPTARHTLRYEFAYGKQNLYYNDVLHKTSTKNISTLSESNTIGLFTVKNSNGTIQSTYMERDVFLYGCKIYKNSELVRDFIPVRVDTVGYLYDKVSKQLFGNLGTGNFILGPDIKGKGYDSEIEYLEFTGTQYVDTNFDVYDTDKVEVGVIATFTISSGTAEACIMGTYTTTFWFPIMFNNGSKGPYQYFNGNKAVVGSGYVNGNRYDIISEYNSSQTKITCSINGEEPIIKTSTGITPKHSTCRLLLMSGINVNNLYQTAKGKLLYCKIYKNDVLLWDAVPVRIKQTGCLYDKISKQIFDCFGNINSFILGPDKA